MLLIKEFNQGLSVVLTCAGKDPGLSEFMAVCIEFLPENILRLVAVDGHRLAFIDFACAHGQDGTEFILYSEYAKKVLKSFAKSIPGNLSIVAYDDSIIFTNGDITETYPKHKAGSAFSPYRQALKHQGKAAPSVRINPQYIADAMAAFKPICDNEIEVSLQATGPNYFTPQLKEDLKNIVYAQTVIMGLA